MARRRRSNNQKTSARRGSTRPASRPLHRRSVTTTTHYTSRPFNSWRQAAIIPTFEREPVKRRPTILTAPRRALSSPSIAQQNLQSLISRAFVAPEIKKLSVCAKRSIRRQVIFANGRGGTRVKKPTYKPSSEVRC